MSSAWLDQAPWEVLLCVVSFSPNQCLQGRPDMPSAWGLSTLSSMSHAGSLPSEFGSQCSYSSLYLESVVTPGSFSCCGGIIVCYSPSQAWMKLVLSYTCLACFVLFCFSPLLLEDFVKLKKLEMVIRYKIHERLRQIQLNTSEVAFKGKVFRMPMAVCRKVFPCTNK